MAKKSFLFGHLFFNITNVFCAKKRVGHACICPRMVTSVENGQRQHGQQEQRGPKGGPDQS